MCFVGPEEFKGLHRTELIQKIEQDRDMKREMDRAPSTEEVKTERLQQLLNCKVLRAKPVPVVSCCANIGWGASGGRVETHKTVHPSLMPPAENKRFQISHKFHDNINQLGL